MTKYVSLTTDVQTPRAPNAAAVATEGADRF